MGVPSFFFQNSHQLLKYPTAVDILSPPFLLHIAIPRPVSPHETESSSVDRSPVRSVRGRLAFRGQSGLELPRPSVGGRRRCATKLAQKPKAAPFHVLSGQRGKARLEIGGGPRPRVSAPSKSPRIWCIERDMQ